MTAGLPQHLGWRIGLLLALVVPTIFAGYQAWNDRPLGKDSVRSYAYLHSIVFDRDLDFHNEFVATYPKYASDPWFVEETGKTPNWKPVGSTLFWLPGYLLVVLLGLDPTGLGAASRGVCAFISAGVFSVGIAVSASLTRPHSRFPWQSALIVAAGSFFLKWWLFPDLSGHAIAAGLAAIYVWVWLRTLDDQRAGAWLVLGALGGLVAIVRWQNALLPLVSLCWKVARSRDWRKLPVGLVAFGLGFGALFSLQAVVWHSVYGRWLTTPQPQGSFMHWFKPYLVDTLFSPRYGLLGFSPVLYLSVIGLLMGVRHWRRPLRGLGVLYLLVVVYVNASAGDWYAGATFGPRRMDSLFPFLVLGTGVALDGLVRLMRRRSEALVTGMAVASVLFTGVLLVAYQAREFNRGMVGAHEFPYRAWDSIVDAVGWPPSLPAGLYHAGVSGMRVGQYSKLAGDDTLTWLDGRLEPEPKRLDAGWSLSDSGARLEAPTGRFYIYLMDLGFHYSDIRVSFRLVGDPRQLGRWSQALARGHGLEVNGVEVRGRASVNLDTQVLRGSVDVRYATWQPGVNYLEFRGEGIELQAVHLEELES